MKYIHIAVITIFFLLCSFSLYGQMDMKGTDFWLTFGRNHVSVNNPDGELNLQIRVVGSEQAATGNIYFTNLGYSVPFSVAAGQVYTHSLNNLEKQAACNETTGLNNLSVHITSSSPITVYALNQFFRTTDATNILPITALGTEYYQMSYTTTSSYPDAYGIIATQDNTQIYHNGALTGILNMGEVYYHTHGLDMTGEHITADKPVAFFAMHQGPQIPNGLDYIDILFQQLAPVNTWGKNFFVPVSWRGKDFVRIMASQNGTNIKQTGGTIRQVSGGQSTLTNLNAGEWVELEVSSDNNGCHIQADKPVGVCTYLTATRYNDPTDELSDPAQAWLPSIEQKIHSALIAPFMPEGESNLSEHFALIITPTATKNYTTVITINQGAEQALSGGRWYDHATAGMSFYSMPLLDTTSAYLFTNREGGLVVMGYGTGVAESYYYLSFSAMRTLDAAFYVNNIHYQDLEAEFICEQPVQFRAEINGDVSTDPGFLKWYINDVEETAVRDQLTWSKTFAPDTYQIKIEALMDGNMEIKTVEAQFVITADTAKISGDTLLCVNHISALTGTPSNGKWKSMNPTVATVTSTGILRGLTTGTAEIKYTSCTDSTSIIVRVTSLTANAITTPEFCDKENGTITLTVNSETPTTVRYVWHGLSDTTSALTGMKSGTYKVRISDTYCPIGIEETIEIEYVDGPIADFKLGENAIVKNEEFTLTDISQGTVQTWNWDVGDGNKKTGKIVHHKYKETGYHKISLEIIDANQCIDTISKTVYVHDELKVYIPNTFTPNGDGINDTWKPVMSNYLTQGYQLAVFDRWGQQVFHTTNTEEAWDGTINGNKVMSNTIYSYQVIIQNIAGKEYSYTGHVTLIR